MYDFLIIGGGLIGLLTARELASAGGNVALIDRKLPGQESSWAAGGILSPLFPWEYPEAINQLNERSQFLYPELSDTLHRQTDIDPELALSGMLLTSLNDLEKASHWYATHGVSCLQLQQDDIQTRFPSLCPQGSSALHLAHIGHIRPPALMQALIQSLTHSGVQILEHHAAKTIEYSGNLVSGVTLENGKRLQAGQYVVCAGAWSPTLWPPGTPTIDIQPVKGQMILYPNCGIQLQCMYMHDHRYLIQRRDGRILVGSSIEHSGFDQSISKSMGAELIEFAEKCCPALRNVAIEKHWSGLRPSSPSSVPYIDKHPIFSNLSINSGHFRNGIVLAPASAEMLAALVLEKPLHVDPTAFSFAGHASR